MFIGWNWLNILNQANMEVCLKKYIDKVTVNYFSLSIIVLPITKNRWGGKLVKLTINQIRNGDIAFSGNHYPLEHDSIDILTSLGMEYRGKFKMVLAIAPWSNKMDTQSRLPATKNFCQVNGIWRKYEPIFYFRKPR
jgi:hypothetical protein